MLSTLSLTLSLALIATQGSSPPPPVARTLPAPQATQERAAAAVAPAAVKPTVKPATPPSSKREATLRSTVEKKREAAIRKKASRAKLRALEARQAEEWRLYVERVGPIIAQQQREAWNQQMDARRTAALEGMSMAAQQEAITDRARFRLQTQQAGVPQVFVPGQGMMPFGR